MGQRHRKRMVTALEERPFQTFRLGQVPATPAPEPLPKVEQHHQEGQPAPQSQAPCWLLWKDLLYSHDFLSAEVPRLHESLYRTPRKRGRGKDWICKPSDSSRGRGIFIIFS
eukprot:14198_3